MNHCVPDFEMEEDYSIPTSSGLIRPRKSAIGEEEIMELLWQNGQVVVQSQNQRSSKRAQYGGGSGGAEPVIPLEQSLVREIRSNGEQETATQNLYMQEDEMASWLHYPLDDSSFDRDLYADLLYSTPPPTPVLVTTVSPPREAADIRPPPMPPRPPMPTPAQMLEAPQSVQNFGHFSRVPRARIEPISGPSSSSKAAVRESTVVESNETPMVGSESMVSRAAAISTTQVCGGNKLSATDAAAHTSTAARELATITGELSLTSSPGGSGASVSPSPEPHAPPQKPMPASPADERKRKFREAYANDCRSEDIEFESADIKKQARGSTSTKRSRAAEVHNQSERRRRDRINEKMRALQELIPRCNKSDKASMLDEAIEYLKSLQLQVQMMSMGCGMIPIMYPGVQQCMPAMGMGMGMGMEMGMNRPMVPYPSLLPGSAMPNPAAASHMGPRFHVPTFHMPPVPVPEPSRTQTSNQCDPMLNSLVANPNQPQIPNFVDPYQQFLGLHQAQFPLPQNLAMVQPGTNKPISSKEIGKAENRQPG